jgi:hypothetical protein
LVSSDINKMVVKMTLWNKVFPDSPYLDERPVRVGSARSVDYLQIFAVGVFIRRCSWLSFVGVVLISFFDLFFVKFRFLQPAGLVMMVCNPALLGVLPQPIFFQRLLDLVVSKDGFCGLQSLVWRWHLQVPLSLVAFPEHFKLRWTANFARKKTTRVLFNVILFSFCHCVSSCLSLVLLIVFLDMNQI